MVSDELEAVLHLFIFRPVDHFLGPVHSDGGVGGNLGGYGVALFEGLIKVGEEVVDDPQVLSLLGTEKPASEGELVHQGPVFGDEGESGKGSEISGHSDLDFPDGHLAVPSGYDDVAGGNQVDSGAQAIAVDHRNDGDFTLFDCQKAVLQDLNDQFELVSLPGHIGFRVGDFGEEVGRRFLD